MREQHKNLDIQSLCLAFSRQTAVFCGQHRLCIEYRFGKRVWFFLKKLDYGGRGTEVDASCPCFRFNLDPSDRKTIKQLGELWLLLIAGVEDDYDHDMPSVLE